LLHIQSETDSIFQTLLTLSLQAQQARPNIILLMGDDHGWEEVGYNGPPYVKTPFLDGIDLVPLLKDEMTKRSTPIALWNLPLTNYQAGESARPARAGIEGCAVLYCLETTPPGVGMATLAPELLFTVDDYLSMPEGGPRYELIEGDLIMAPAPNSEHQDIARDISFAFITYARTHGGKVYFSPLDVYLDDHNVVQPDILWISPARVSRVSKRGLEGAPDLVVEILSKSTKTRDKNVKLKLYRRFGVREYWLVDPKTSTIEIHCFQHDNDVRTLAVDDLVVSPVLPGFEMPVKQLIRPDLSAE
jgi:Uma2 family endonuclease